MPEISTLQRLNLVHSDEGAGIDLLDDVLRPGDVAAGDGRIDHRDLAVAAMCDEFGDGEMSGAQGFGDDGAGLRANTRAAWNGPVPGVARPSCR